MRVIFCSIKVRVFATILGIMIVASTLLIWFVHAQAKKVLVDHEMVDLFDETKLTCRDIAAEIQGARDLALRLAIHPVIRRLEENRDAADWDRALREAEKLIRDELAQPSASNDLRIEWRENADLNQPAAITVDQKDVKSFDLIDGENQLAIDRTIQARIRGSSRNVCYLPVRRAKVTDKDGPGENYIIQVAVVGRSTSVRHTIHGMLLVTLNLQELFTRLNQSYRHLVFIADEQGQILVRPTVYDADTHTVADFDPASNDDVNKWLMDPVIPVPDELVPNPAFRVDWRQESFSFEWIPPSELHFHQLKILVEPEASQDQRTLLTEYFEKWKPRDPGLIAPVTISLRTKEFGVRHRSPVNLEAIWDDLATHPELISFLKRDSQTIPCTRFKRVLYQVNLEPHTRKASDLITQTPNNQVEVPAVQPWLHIGMAVAIEDIEADISKELRQTIILALLWCLLAAVLGLFYILLRLNLLSRIQRATQLFAEGKSDEAKLLLPKDAQGEFGNLALSFDAMIDQVEKQQKTHQAVLDSAAEAIITVDDQGKIWTFNKAATNLFGYEEKDIKEKSVSRLVRFRNAFDDPQATKTPSVAEFESFHFRQNLFTHFKNNETHEAVGVPRHGDPFPIEYAGSPVPLNDDTVIYMMVIRNIESRKKLEEMEKNVRNRLQEEVDLKTVELRKAVDDLKKVDQLKNVFLATVSHELRTPLNHIFLAGQWLIKEPLADVHKEDIHNIIDSARYLNALVKDLLDFMKIIDGKIELHPEEVNVADFLEKLCESMTSDINKRSNRLELKFSSNLGKVAIDPVRFRQVVTNLLHNAAKFTERGCITLSARRELRPAGEMVVVRVIDTGIGIPKEKQDKLFVPFSKIHGRKENLEGTGLGLAICKQICISMGGGIEVESDTNKGSTFIATFDAGSVDVLMTSGMMSLDPSGPITTTAISTGGSVREVLIVDDDDKTRELMKRTLEELGFRVSTASSGIEALEMVRRRPPAVILLDVLMPSGISGWAVLAALKNNDDTMKIPIVIVSVLDERERAATLGASGYLVKPIQDWQSVTMLIRKYQSTNRKVLIIEDDALLRTRCGHVLQADGWDVRESATPTEAIQLTDGPSPALILLDLEPFDQALPLLEKIRSVPEWRGTPIIAWSHHELTEAVRSQLDRTAVRQILLLPNADQEGLLKNLCDEVNRFLAPPQ